MNALKAALLLSACLLSSHASSDDGNVVKPIKNPCGTKVECPDNIDVAQMIKALTASKVIGNVAYSLNQKPTITTVPALVELGTSNNVHADLEFTPFSFKTSPKIGDGSGGS